MSDIHSEKERTLVQRKKKKTEEKKKKREKENVLLSEERKKKTEENKYQPGQNLWSPVDYSPQGREHIVWHIAQW